VPQEPGKQKRKPRKPPERSDALRINLEFDEAVRAALETEPPPPRPSKRKKRKKV
jgi:hypothetical protein